MAAPGEEGVMQEVVVLLCNGKAVRFQADDFTWSKADGLLLIHRMDDERRKEVAVFRGSEVAGVYDPSAEAPPAGEAAPGPPPAEEKPRQKTRKKGG